jgi:hypothetical protein
MENLMNKPLLHATLGDFVEAMRQASKVEEKESDTPQLVHGIAGLASILGCSIPTAQKLKSSGRVPYIQEGRKVIFEVDKVLEAIRDARGKKVLPLDR